MYLDTDEYRGTQFEVVAEFVYYYYYYYYYYYFVYYYYLPTLLTYFTYLTYEWSWIEWSFENVLDFEKKPLRRLLWRVWSVPQ